LRTAVACLAGLLGLCLAGTVKAAELHQAAEVRKLSVEQAQSKIPVHLEAVVTFFDEVLYSRFVQDSTAGIYLRESTNTPPLRPGQLVQVIGFTSPGEYAPIVEPQSVRVIGEAALPQARRVSHEQLASGAEDSQFVEITGVVRSAQKDEASQHYLVQLATSGGRISVYSKTLPVSKPGELVDSRVRVRGVCSTQFNRQRQLFAVRLLVPRPDDLAIETPQPTDAFGVEVSPIASLLRFTAGGNFGHRVKVAGNVTYYEPGRVLFVQDGAEGLQVFTTQRDALQPGDRMEILGFASQGEYTPVLQDAVFRKVGTGPAPEAPLVSPDEALKGTHDCRLIRLRGRLLERARHSREQFLVLEADKFIFPAYLQIADGADAFSMIQNGSLVEVTGICLIEPGDWFAGEAWRAKSLRILLRSPGDVRVLQAPPWWTLGKVLWMASALGLAAAAAFVWVAVLRRKVQEQTGIIRERLEAEATLKERYVDLFENANDMVYTHDLTGVITSINQAGERLLQRPRTSLVSRNLLDLVAEEQRSAARQWLEQVVAGNDTPPAEWDFLNTANQRVKLEISARLIHQHGRPVEVEGVARDVIERHRLEREVLAISTREQRRIGHDLHDGVCQQLAGISYLADILEDKLQEQGLSEAADAAKISALISEANAQARAVSRGLFPVRLEESGLIATLEEFAASASDRFKIECALQVERPPERLDSPVALHLYYITQEAVLNAVRHGKATRVIISLAPEGDRYRINIQDNGLGFRLAETGRTGMGIRIMRFRANVIGATLDLQSQPGQGTLIRCVFEAALREPHPDDLK
jgi:PAS domain S-box-containing protein